MTSVFCSASAATIQVEAEQSRIFDHLADESAKEPGEDKLLIEDSAPLSRSDGKKGKSLDVPPWAASKHEYRAESQR